MEVDKRLDALQKYLPFLDYLISGLFGENDAGKLKKFQYMKDMITERKRHPLSVYEKTEAALKIIYKGCASRNLSKDIHRIFHEIVDLCSDDESASPSKQKSKLNSTETEKHDKPLSETIIVNLDDDDDDIEIISVTKPDEHKKQQNDAAKTNASKSNTEKQDAPQTSVSKTDAANDTDENENGTENLLNRIDKNFIESEKKNKNSISDDSLYDFSESSEPSKNSPNKNGKEENHSPNLAATDLFKRRCDFTDTSNSKTIEEKSSPKTENIQEKSDKEEPIKKSKKRKKKHKKHKRSKEIIAIDSSSEDEQSTARLLNSKTNENASPKSPTANNMLNDNNLQPQPKTNVLDSEALEEMNLDQLNFIKKNLTNKIGRDFLRQFIKNIISEDEEEEENETKKKDTNNASTSTAGKDDQSTIRDVLKTLPLATMDMAQQQNQCNSQMISPLATSLPQTSPQIVPFPQLSIYGNYIQGQQASTSMPIGQTQLPVETYISQLTYTPTSELISLIAANLPQAAPMMPTVQPQTMSTVPPQTIPTVPPQAMPTVPPQRMSCVPPQTMPTVLPHGMPTVLPHTLPNLTQNGTPIISPQAMPTVRPHIMPITPPHTMPNVTQHRTPTMPPHTTGIIPQHPTNISYQSNGPSTSRLNLKDPRILKKLSNPQNSCYAGITEHVRSPLLPMPGSTTAQPSVMPVVASGASASASHLPTIHEPVNSQRPKTYGEYRREKERKEQEEIRRVAQREQQRAREAEEQTKRRAMLEEEQARRAAEQRRRQDLEAEEERKRKAKLEEEEKRRIAEREAEEMNRRESEKQTDEIKRILTMTLNPYDKKIKSVARLQAEPETNNEHQKSKDEKVSPDTNRRKIDRIFKDLHCSINGFNELQDYVSTDSDGKRRCSVNARVAIAEQFNKTPPTVVQNTKYDSSDDVSTDDTLPIDQPDKPNSSFEYFEESKSKRSKSPIGNRKISIKPRHCVVRIKRLTEKEIRLHTQKQLTNSLLEPPVKQRKLEPVVKTTWTGYDAKTIAKETNKPTTKTLAKKRTGSKTLVCANNDPFMTERITTTCPLCHKNSKNLTNHCICIHKTESYVARLTWDELDDLEINIPFAELVNQNAGNKRCRRYKLKCPFCPAKNNEIISPFNDLYKHYSTHTGEYAYQCKKCLLQKPLVTKINEHQNNSKCKNAGLNVLYQYPQDRMVIYINCCVICNYAQLNEANVYKHLREQHQKKRDEPSNTRKYILAAIKGEEEKTDAVDPMEAEDTSEIFPNDDSVCVQNEPIFDDNMDIKPDINELNMSKECFLPTTDFIKTEYSEDIKPDLDFLNEEMMKEAMEKNMQVDQKPDLEKLNIEFIKPLLIKLTASSGVRSDLLYQCPISTCNGFFHNHQIWSHHISTRHSCSLVKCPHCVRKGGPQATQELTLEDFKTHFEKHCLHTYVCYHCAYTFVDEQQIREHVKEKHQNINELRIECIPFNICYSYYVVIDTTALLERIEFLTSLKEVLHQRLDDIKLEEAQKITTQWLLSPEADWMDDIIIPRYDPPSSDFLVCFFPHCNHKENDIHRFWQHIQAAHKPMFVANCTKCGIMLKVGGSWDVLSNHYFCHSSDIHMCGICSYYHYDRKNVAMHIGQDHDSRDVDLLSLIRSENSTKVEISFVFARKRKTFTTLKQCFCCSVNNLDTSNYIAHLKNVHSLILNYFCAICDEPLPQLQHSDEHFSINHDNVENLKIRCQIACKNENQLKIVSRLPLCVTFGNEMKINGCSESIPQIPIVEIKKEKLEEDGIEFLEDDIIVAENEAKACRNEQKTQISLNCININKLTNLIPQLTSDTHSQVSQNEHSYAVKCNAKVIQVIPGQQHLNINPTVQVTVSSYVDGQAKCQVSPLQKDQSGVIPILKPQYESALPSSSLSGQQYTQIASKRIPLNSVVSEEINNYSMQRTYNSIVQEDTQGPQYTQSLQSTSLEMNFHPRPQ